MSVHGAWRSFFDGHALGKWDHLVVSAVLLFYSVLVLMVILVVLYPSREYLAIGPTSDNRVMNFLEIVYFIANSAVAIVAVAALKFAREQFRQSRLQTNQLIHQNKLAEHARTTTIYMDISRRWDSEEMSKSRRTLYRLAEFYGQNRDRIPFDDVADYIHHVLYSDPDGAWYNDFVTVVSFIEDIGLLCQKEYVKLEDVNDIIGSGLHYFIGLVIGLIAEERTSRPGEPPRRTIYAFTLWLYGQLGHLSPYSIEGYGAS